MNLFRSEEHVSRWLGTRPDGATISVSDLSALAHGWWSDRLLPGWRPHKREDNEAVLRKIGLVDEFWRLG
jgi:hypothetical protein